MEDEQKYANPVFTDVPPDDGGGGSIDCEQPRMLGDKDVVFDSDDIEQQAASHSADKLAGSTPKKGGKPTEAQLRAAFNMVDKDRSGELDREEVRLAAKQVGHIFTDAELLEAVNSMDDGGNTNGFVDFEEFASFWLGKGWWDADEDGETHHHAAGSEVSSGGFADKCAKLSRLITGRNAIESNTKQKDKQVEPESIFVIASDMNQGNRDRAELMDKIQEIHESDFHRLEDAFMTYAESQVNEMVWETCCVEAFAEQDVIQGLGWEPRHVNAAREALSQAVEQQAEIDKTDSELEGLSKGFLEQVCWRCFLKEELAHKATAGSTLHRKTSWDSEGVGPVRVPKVGSPQQVAGAAKSFIASTKGELQVIFDLESLPLDLAVEAVVNSLEEESQIRAGKIAGLVSRMKALEENRQRTGRTYTPRRVKISGLPGDAAAANGVYSADGLRASWRRPVYIQEHEVGQSDFVHYLWYDQRMVRDDETGENKWGDGSWSIGPTQNSDRCTAYLLEETKDGVVQELMHPAMLSMDEAPFWNVYDVVQKKWRSAPGDHCPVFSVSAATDDDTIQDYIRKSIAEQSETHEKIQKQCSSANFKEHVRKKLSKFSKRKSEGGGIDRKSFNDYVKKFHEKELRKMQSSIILQILAANDQNKLTLPAENDLSENYQLVQTIVQRFLSSCEQKQKLRTVQKRHFLTRMNRPSMAKAFFSWKLVSSSTKANKDVASNMFAEPQTPWNVRHPRSKFTTAWEGCQAFLLIYVAFTVTYRLGFNVEVGGFWAFFDYCVDLYFICDVIFNFHTAYYDESGDLAGVKDGPEGEPVADLPAMYWKYARGWMCIDLLSVAPTVAMFFIDTSESAQADPQQSKAIKAIRLIRLAKLLRLVRGMRLFKKYEELFGPSLSLLLMFGIIGLVVHSITCVWYVVGTMPSVSVDALQSRSVGWLQFVFKFDYCNCYDNSTVFDKYYPGQPFDEFWALDNPPPDPRFRTNGTYFDPYDKKCHNLLLEFDTKPICDTNIELPTNGEYYVKALFTVFRDPQINDQYKMSFGEMCFAMITTMVMGSTWGVVAGTFSTIFAGNQLATQTYKMRVKQLKEFCRIKELPHATREKLEAHYHHLYPDKMMIDEEDVIGDLPPLLREELVGTLYGRQLYAVPLFLNLSTHVLTELCMKLVPLPALKGSLIAREGSRGTHMFCITSGTVKITEKIKDGNDVSRLRDWVEAVFGQANKDIVLIKPSVESIIDQLLETMRKLARDTDAPRQPGNDDQSKRVAVPQRLSDVGKLKSLDKIGSKVSSTDSSNMIWADGSDSDEDSDDEQDELQKRLKKIQSAGPICRVSFKSLLYNDHMIELCRETNTNLRLLIEEAGKRGKIQFQGTLELSKADPEGPLITQVGDNSNEIVANISQQQLLCEALQDGEILIDLIKLLSPRLAYSDLTKKTTRERNIQNVVTMMTDPEGAFKMPAEIAFMPSDLLEFDQGPSVLQSERQRRVVAALLELGFVATHMGGYMGPKLDDLALGVLGPGQFFAELSVLPIESGWRHRRSAMVTQNAMLHSLSKVDVAAVANRFPELRNRLVDQAEDYVKVEAAAEAAAAIENLSTIRASVDPNARNSEAAINDQDPLAILKAQLSQQDAKLEQQDAELRNISGQVGLILKLLEKSSTK